jgi:hypothetical protein
MIRSRPASLASYMAMSAFTSGSAGSRLALEVPTVGHPGERATPGARAARPTSSRIVLKLRAIAPRHVSTESTDGHLGRRDRWPLDLCLAGVLYPARIDGVWRMASLSCV